MASYLYNEALYIFNVGVNEMPIGQKKASNFRGVGDWKITQRCIEKGGIDALFKRLEKRRVEGNKVIK